LLRYQVKGELNIMGENKTYVENDFIKDALYDKFKKDFAEEAKDAYDQMLSDQSKYHELQKTLEDLTYGTKEWKQALIEANQQVLELLQTYPELTKYLTRGEDG
jgi:Ni,Fe-hydrogenase III component G